MEMEKNRSEFGNGVIWLEEPKSIFYSGQVVNGKLNLELSKPLKILYINAIFKGEANVKWSEQEFETYSGVTRKKEVKYVGNEVYFEQTHCIYGGDGGATILPTGPHSIPFSYQLPHNIPSSFDGDKGGVSYKVTARLLHADGDTAEDIVKKFDVIAPMNLNTDENKEPIQMEFEEVYSCNFSCSPRPLALAIKIPHSGYCPGQVIPITVEARNESNVEVSKIVFEVVKRMRYLSQHPVSSIIPPEERVFIMKKGPILSKTNRQYQFQMKLPAFIALNLDDCGIIDAGYFLKVKMKVSGCNEDMSDEASICLGLVPIGSDLDVKETHPMAESLPMAPIPPIPEIPINTQRNAPTDTSPPPYESVFNKSVPNQENNPPGPGPYPIKVDVVEESVHGSQNNIEGDVETHTFKFLNVRNTTITMNMSNAASDQNGASFTYSSQNAFSAPGFPDIQIPNLPNLPNFGQMFPNNAAPSAPPL